MKNQPCHSKWAQKRRDAFSQPGPVKGRQRRASERDCSMPWLSNENIRLAAANWPATICLSGQGVPHAWVACLLFTCLAYLCSVLFCSAVLSACCSVTHSFCSALGEFCSTFVPSCLVVLSLSSVHFIGVFVHVPRWVISLKAAGVH